MKLDCHEVRKVTNPDFCEKVQSDQEGPTSLKNKVFAVLTKI